MSRPQAVRVVHPKGCTRRERRRQIAAGTKELVGRIVAFVLVLGTLATLMAIPALEPISR